MNIQTLTLNRIKISDEEIVQLERIFGGTLVTLRFTQSTIVLRFSFKLQLVK